MFVVEMGGMGEWIEYFPSSTGIEGWRQVVGKEDGFDEVFVISVRMRPQRFWLKVVEVVEAMDGEWWDVTSARLEIGES